MFLRREQNVRNPTGDQKMMFPIRCFSCGKPIAHLHEKYTEMLEAGKSSKQAMDKLEVRRFCCRAVFMGHIELIDNIAPFKKF